MNKNAKSKLHGTVFPSHLQGAWGKMYAKKAKEARMKETLDGKTVEDPQATLQKMIESQMGTNSFSISFKYQICFNFFHG